MAIPRRLQPLVGVLQAIGRLIVVRQRQLSAALAPGKHRAGLHDQVVNREVRRRLGQGLAQLPIPGLKALLRQVDDQIQAPALQERLLLGLPQPAAGFPQLAGAVTAPQPLKHAIIKALPTEADAIDAQRQHRLKALAIKAGWIHLQADLSAGRQAPVAANCLQQLRQLISRQHRRGAATDVNG